MTITKSQETAADVAALLRARNPLLWVVTREEARVEGYLMEAAAAAGYVPLTWDCAQGVADMAGRPAPRGGADPGETLQAIKTATTGGTAGRIAWLLRDLHPWLQGPIGRLTGCATGPRAALAGRPARRSRLVEGCRRASWTSEFCVFGFN